MSRIIVKNLPKTITEDKLRQVFSQKGILTDVQLKYTPDGKFRQFAFVGFQEENEAKDAIGFFDNTFISTNRIRVEPCAQLGDSAKPKAWSKYAPDSSTYKRAHPGPVQQEKIKTKKPRKEATANEADHLLDKYKDDPLFEEFLQVHAPEESKKLRNQVKDGQKTKSDEDSAIESDGEKDDADSDAEELEKEENKVANEEISDLEYMKTLMKKTDESKTKQKTKKEPKNLTLFTLKLQDLPYKCKKKDIKQFFKPVVPFSIRIPRKIHGIAYLGFKKEKDFNKALLKDRSILSGKRVSVIKYVPPVNQDGSNGRERPMSEKWKSQEEFVKNEEDIAESGIIFFRNLAYTIQEDEIESMFSKFGDLVDVSLPVDPVTKKIKGFGTVTFQLPEHAVRAYAELDGTILHGRLLHLLPGKSKDTTAADDLLEESTDFKKKKAAKQKAQAGSSHNWNSLFLGHDAVAQVVADSFETSKADVLGVHGRDNAFVTLALGETKIVAQTRQYLEEQGVILDAFSTPTLKKSKTVILVKNLPTKTEVQEIRPLFETFGTLNRVILPPGGITAVVEFAEPFEAKNAFKKLAYSRFKYVPLYLEWAPENSLKEKPVSKKPDQVSSTKQKEVDDHKVEDSSEIAVAELKKEEEEEEEEEAEPDTTLFVKNLNFKTTDEDLKKHFEGCGKICYATVATKKDTKNPGNKLSMGYGFVRFFLKSDADGALKTLQQSSLDGKSLELKRSERSSREEVKTAKKSSKKTKQTGTKILVRNVPFQAKKKELEELFSSFGQIKALRLPKKMSLESGGTHRGFAFVDYVAESGAKKAFEALSQSTHFYGRRLVLEWAAPEESVDEMRKRTASQFKASEEVRSKKSTLNLDDKF